LVATPIVATNLVGRTINRIAAGASHDLTLADDGTVFSFGWGAFGATGLGTFNDALIATPIVTTNLGSRTITQVATGLEHSFLLADDGSVFSFGANGAGQLGLGTSDSSVSVATPIDTTNLGGRTIIQIAAGFSHSLLLADDGSVFSFGTNGYGGTGLGTATGNTLVATPIDTSNLGGRKIVQVAGGDKQSLLLAEDGSVFSFGFNDHGQLGLGTTGGGTSVATPIDATNLGGRKIIQVATDFAHSLLLADDGSVFSFGYNSSGMTGLGTTTGDTLIATPINTSNLGGRKIAQISAGRIHNLLLAEDGTVFSFGSNLVGQLGLGTSGGIVSVATPIDTTNLGALTVTQIDAGNWFNLLIAEPRLPGDYNNDGAVDGADYVMWRKTGGQTGAGLAADGDQDHQIDSDDYNVWRGNFGQFSFGSGSGAATGSPDNVIPEPSTLLILLLAAGSVCFRRHRNQTLVSQLFEARNTPSIDPFRNSVSP
jgi:alpha-tubulin suppressor-like RCC1 family protein